MLCQLVGAYVSMVWFRIYIHAFRSGSFFQAKQTCLAGLSMLSITETRSSPASVGSILLIRDEVPIEMIVWLACLVGLVPGSREPIPLVSSIVRVLPVSLTV